MGSRDRTGPLWAGRLRAAATATVRPPGGRFVTRRAVAQATEPRPRGLTSWTAGWHCSPAASPQVRVRARPDAGGIDRVSEPAQPCRISVRGSRGGAPRQPNVAHWVGWLMTLNGVMSQPSCLRSCARPSSSSPPVSSSSPAWIFSYSGALLDAVPCSICVPSLMSVPARSRPTSLGARCDRTGGAGSVRSGHGHSAALSATPCSAGSAIGGYGRCAPATYAPQSFMSRRRRSNKSDRA